MKLLYLANIRLPTEKAHGLQIVKMCEALADQGLEVTLVLPHKFTPLKEDLYHYYQVKKNFKTVKISSVNLLALDWLLGKLGFILESWWFAKSARSLIKKEQPDIVYTREHLLAWLVGKYHQRIYLENHVFPQSAFYQKCLAKVKGIIVITNKLQELHQPFNKPVLVAADGVKVEEFNLPLSQTEARKKLNLPVDKKIVLYSGHLYAWKGVDVLLEAAGLLPDDCLVYIVGGTEKDIVDFSSKLKAQSSKLFLIGHRPYQEIPIWLKAADVLVLTGNPQAEISKNYTSPMKLFEYLASERVIVASDLPSFREVLNERNSILVRAGDAQAMASGIKQALSDSELSSRLARQGYQDVLQYNWLERALKIKEFIWENENFG